LSDDGIILITLALASAALAIAFVFRAWRSRDTALVFSANANRRYFSRPLYGLATICVIALVTVFFIAMPDRLPQALGSFGVFALFIVCLTFFSVHASLLTIKHRVPYIPLICGVALVIGVIGGDNHEIRTIYTTATTSELPRISAKEAFTQWVTQPDRVANIKRAEIYPVFVVSAQGGGLYAAYNTATFLARLIDLCPGFRRHLFAISSVSGGSVGAAVFASALRLSDGAQSSISNSAIVTGLGDGSCKTISTFLSHSQELFTLDTPGVIEQRVQQVLGNDFLAPLVAGSLFPDFTQLFIPVPIGPFDRARTLEYTLENALDRIADDSMSPLIF